MSVKPRRLELIPPGEILRLEFMEPNGVSQNRLAPDLDVPVGRINEIVHDKRSITADTALRLARYFGTSAEFWLALQADYDLRRARRELGAAIEARVRTIAA
jgi:addiction module HigA family antidote